MQILAPAKINLHLRVGPLRADGFHPLLTWMTTIGLHDTISLELPGGKPGLRPVPGALESPAVADQPAQAQIPCHGVRMTCSDPSLPTDDRNLVVKAAKLLGGDAELSVAIHLEKKIPHGGGLGGGSSDAAFTLYGLNQLWNLGHGSDHLAELAATLGSDVPFFLHGPSSVCRGRGELIRPIALPAIAKWAVLILPDLSMPTPAVYRQFDAMQLGHQAPIDQEPDWNQWAALSSQQLLRRLVNDLEAPAFAIEPRLAKLRAAIEDQLGRPVRMSGSGSSLFTLYDDQTGAKHAAFDITRQHSIRAIAVEIAE
jgi:4-diphosphocytidyl-2-C-methyl-D-erythritol kinase